MKSVLLATDQRGDVGRKNQRSKCEQFGELSPRARRQAQAR